MMLNWSAVFDIMNSSINKNLVDDSEKVSCMDLKKLYYQVKSYIDIVDFSKLWRGFEPLKFALYSDNECFFDGAYIEKTDAFLANTSILYNGEWIAIAL